MSATRLDARQRGRRAARALASSGRLVAAAALLAAAGLAVAGYLAATHAAGQPIACTGIGDCDYVNASEYASVAGIRVAELGAVSYATVLFLMSGVLLKGWRSWLIAAWGVAFASLAFSIHLTSVELLVLEAICAWCVASAAIVTALFAVLTLALLSDPAEI